MQAEVVYSAPPQQGQRLRPIAPSPFSFPADQRAANDRECKRERLPGWGGGGTLPWEVGTGSEQRETVRAELISALALPRTA